MLDAYVSVCFFFFNDTATTEIYTLSLHDALPIWKSAAGQERPKSVPPPACGGTACNFPRWTWRRDRKSTRLNSSHSQISYAVFCLKKKNGNPEYEWAADNARWNQHVLVILSDTTL